MVRYMKCPRCELNYIDADVQEFCDVCLKEMKGISFADELVRLGPNFMDAYEDSLIHRQNEQI